MFTFTIPLVTLYTFKIFDQHQQYITYIDTHSSQGVNQDPSFHSVLVCLFGLHYNLTVFTPVQMNYTNASQFV